MVVAGGASALALFPGPVAAQAVCYPPGSPACTTTTTAQVIFSASLTVSDLTLIPGQQFQVTATGYLAGTTVTFTIESVEQLLGTATANAQGVASATVRVPSDLPAGVHTVRSKGTGADGRPLVLSRPVTVVLSAVTGPVRSGVGSTPGGSLTRTGASVVTTSAVGVGLVVGGLVLTRSVKKRKAVA